MDMESTGRLENAMRARWCGPCCCCNEARGVFTLYYLDGLCPTEGAGWGCEVCKLGPDGALAVVCDACASQIEAGVAKLRYICADTPFKSARTPYAAMQGSWRHDLTKHMSEEGGF